MVLDEVDAANAKMQKGKKAPASAPVAESNATPSRTDSSTLLQESKKWWTQATSVTSESMDSSIVHCRIDGSTQFMARDDCLSRGGQPGKTSS